MTVVAAVTMMRDEEDVAVHTIKHLVEERIDVIIVADNNSTDSTREQLDDAVAWAEACGSQLVVIDDPEEGYYQSRKMTELAHRAHNEFGAEWIVPFDADEIWYSRKAHLGDHLRSLQPNIRAAGALLYNHFTTDLDEEGNPFQAMVWRQVDHGALPKVAVRWHETLVIHQGNHSAQICNSTLQPENLLELRHFPYRSAAHFIRKARNGAEAYRKATDLHKNEGAHWRQYGDLLDRYGEEALIEVYEKYFHFMAPIHEGMIHDPAPFRRWT
jgi:hypothetical protein